MRRRTLLAAGLATVAAGSTAGVWLGGGTGDDAQPVASPMLDNPTRGNLPGDGRFPADLDAVWLRHVGTDIAVRGRPHAVWAGTTPQGLRAAVLAQRVAQRVVPLTGDALRFALRADEPGPSGGRQVALANLAQLQPAPRAPAARDPRWDLLGRDGYADPYGYGGGTGDDWYIRGVTPDGRPFVVQTLQSRLFLMLGAPDPAYLGLLDPRAPLAVQVRLPDRQGIVVASRGSTLRYRVRTGAWFPVPGDAALLPDAATEVERTTRGGTRRAVRLSV